MIPALPATGCSALYLAPPSGTNQTSYVFKARPSAVRGNRRSHQAEGGNPTPLAPYVPKSARGLHHNRATGRQHSNCRLYSILFSLDLTGWHRYCKVSGRGDHLATLHGPLPDHGKWVTRVPVCRGRWLVRESPTSTAGVTRRDKSPGGQHEWSPRGMNPNRNLQGRTS
jgi:hypothetical protein